jgi:hypothetical protein
MQPRSAEVAAARPSAVVLVAVVLVLVVLVLAVLVLAVLVLAVAVAVAVEGQGVVQVGPPGPRSLLTDRRASWPNGLLTERLAGWPGRHSAGWRARPGELDVPLGGQAGWVSGPVV